MPGRRRTQPAAGSAVAKLVDRSRAADVAPVGESWQSSWELVLASYGLIVIAAGVPLMTYETCKPMDIATARTAAGGRFRGWRDEHVDREAIS